MLLLPGCAEPVRTRDSMQGFIVSDAHMGYDGVDQPTLAKQVEMMQVILNRFPDLDVLIDTGDAHHGSIDSALKQIAREQWLACIANQADRMPFFYVPGNHELGRAEGDPEKVTMAMGSLSCRPYYSFDLFGIHFVSLPQLLDTIYVTQETLSWLDLDLQVHQDKTTIILAHNSITGTTYDNDESAYRRLVNSSEVLAVLDGHDQVIAWMHGHNHQYEMVRKEGRLYVSNGRIGGFNPPASWGAFGQGHLGGIFFQIDRDGFEARAFSASANTFLDELDFPALRQRMETSTSFDASAASAVSMGYGGARDGQSVEVHQHFAGQGGTSRAFFLPVASGVINENPGFAMPSELMFAGKLRRKLIGAAARTRNVTWHAGGAGLALVPDGAEVGGVTLYFPKAATDKPRPRRASYYPCQGSQRYALECDIEVGVGGVALELIAQYRDESLAVIHRSEPQVRRIDPGRHTVVFQFQSPAHPGDLYSNIVLDIDEIKSDLTLHSVKLRLDQEGSLDVGVGIDIDVLTVRSSDASARDVPAGAFEEKHRATVTAHTAGRERLTWLLRFEQVRWQVRNATLADFGDRWEIGPRRLTNHNVTDIVIAPVGHSPTTPYVSRLTAISQATIWPAKSDNLKLSIAIGEAESASAVVVHCATRPVRISPDVESTFVDGRLTLVPSGAQKIVLEW